MRSPKDFLAGLLGRGKKARPNIVWICADDFAASVSGAYGNRLARTPNLDRLASDGIRFDRAYCSCPLSTPSRIAFLTGRYPRSVGVTLSPTPLPQGERTIGSLLREAGYQTTALGKTHYYRPLTDQFDVCVDLDDFHTYLSSRPPEAIPPDIELLGRWRPFADPASVWLNAAGLPYAPDSEMPDTYFTNLVEPAINNATAPFFLWVGFYVTHSPFRFPVEFKGLFNPASFSLPEVSPSDLALVPDVFSNLTDEEKQGIIASYYTSVAYMDRNLGRILDAIDRSDQAENTLVIFNSDHGYLLGDHGRFEKHCGYEEAIRAALLMRLPGRIAKGRSTSALVELIDIVPTILDLCRVPIPATIQGRSLSLLLAEKVEHHRDRVIVEYADNAEVILRTEQWKLIYSAGNRRRRDGYDRDWEEPGELTQLFDLAADPAEIRNLASFPEHQIRIGEMITEIANHLRKTGRDQDRLTNGLDLRESLRLGLLPADRIRTYEGE